MQNPIINQTTQTKEKKPKLVLEKQENGVGLGKRIDGRAYTVRDNRDRFFYPKEWIKFFEVIKESQHLTFDFLINTGARINEARNVKVEDVDLANKRIILRVTKVKSKKGEKNPRPRTIPISSQFCKRLKRYIKGKKNEELIGLLSTPAANIAMKKALKKAKIDDWVMFSIHNIRKTIETWLIALDVNSMRISSHMGHDISTALQHYVSPDVFSYDEKGQMKDVIGDLYEKRER